MKTSSLIRKLKLGEHLSFDDGRILIRLEENAPRTAVLRVTMVEDVVVDKPRDTPCRLPARINAKKVH